MSQERQRLYDATYCNISKRQKQHRERFLTLERKRNPGMRCDLTPCDYILVSNKKAAGLATTYLGHFHRVKLTYNGNANMQTQDTRNRPSHQRSIRRERLVPYMYNYMCDDAS